MKTLGIQELQEHMEEIVRLVEEEGETIGVTKKGKVVAHLIPANKSPQPVQEDLETFWANMDRLTAEISSRLPDEPIDVVKIIREGRREF
jgi:prevent-host-death family protein